MAKNVSAVHVKINQKSCRPGLKARVPISGWMCWKPLEWKVWMLLRDMHLKGTVWEVQKLLVLHSAAFTAVSTTFSPGRDGSASPLFIFHFRRRSANISSAGVHPSSHEWSLQNCFLYLGKWAHGHAFDVTANL